MTKHKLLKATHSGKIIIGNITLPCYVLEDGSRVLTQTDTVQTLGLGQFVQLGKFIQQNTIRPYVSGTLQNLLKNRITFKLPRTRGKPAHGYQAIIIAEVCDAVFQAKKEGRLKETQNHIAEQCEILTRSFAKIGIIALISRRKNNIWGEK